MLETLVLYSLLTSAMFYLGSRAKITSFLWSRYPPWFVGFMDCAACTGFWWGFFFAELLGRFGAKWFAPFALPSYGMSYVVALSMIVLTPISAALMQRGLDVLGTIEIESAIEPESIIKPGSYVGPNPWGDQDAEDD